VTQAAVRIALESRLSAWAAARSTPLTVTWENVPADPAQGTTYLRAFLLPALTRSEDLAGAHRAFAGVFQVSIVAPIATGPGAAVGIADEIAAHFPLNGRYTSGSVTVQIVQPASIAPALVEPDAYVVPVSIAYRADTI
jgi:hypothetical protein